MYAVMYIPVFVVKWYGLQSCNISWVSLNPTSGRLSLVRMSLELACVNNVLLVLQRAQEVWWTRYPLWRSLAGHWTHWWEEVLHLGLREISFPRRNADEPLQLRKKGKKTLWLLCAPHGHFLSSLLCQMVTIIDPHIKRDSNYHIHKVWSCDFCLGVVKQLVFPPPLLPLGCSGQWCVREEGWWLGVWGMVLARYDQPGQPWESEMLFLTNSFQTSRF